MSESRYSLAYFSHSYRPAEKEINLFFWEILSEYKLYFKVDAEGKQDRAMDISYLEWMMKSSDCFVAVIPRREENLPYQCSPYQVFEYTLALRAKKPRLIFVEAGLDKAIFGDISHSVLPFRRRKEFLIEDKRRFQETAAAFAKRVRFISRFNSYLTEPVALLIDDEADGAYSHQVKREIRKLVVEELGHSFDFINAAMLSEGYYSLGLQKLQKYSIVISDVRQPYLSLDILGMIHERCIPMIRVCHLRNDENEENAKSAMRLFDRPSNYSVRDSESLPCIFEGFQVDSAMEPIIFWKDLETLINKLRPKIKRVFEEREELLTEQEARDYFLPIGRLEGKVFVSNEKSQNQFVVQELVPKFRKSSVECFHYKREDAITTGARWFAEITTEIKNSSIFVALIDSHYQKSKYCMEELRVALEESRKGRIKIHAYVVEEGVSPPDPLSILQVPHIQDLQDNKKADLVTRDAIRFLETGQCVRLREGDESWLEDLLARLPGLSLPSDRRRLLREAGLPKEMVDTIRTNGQPGLRAASEMIYDLAFQRRTIQPRKKALGLFLSYLIGLVNLEDQKRLAGIIRRYELMPDIREHLEDLHDLHELSLVYLHEPGKVGTLVSIRNHSFDGANLYSSKITANLYSISVNSAAVEKNWHQVLQSIGDDMLQNEAFEDFKSAYQEQLAHRAMYQEQLGFCLVVDPPALRIPFEWAVLLSEQSRPLCLRHPVRRFLVGGAEPRQTLRSMLSSDDATIPLRVLLVASNTGDIWGVEEEIEEIYLFFCDLFEEVGWPTDNICKLNTDEATLDRIEREIQEGGYHLFHFAGHSGYHNDKPILEVFRDGYHHEVCQITASMLRSWIINSDLRFVYLSSCRSASSEPIQFAESIRFFENMVHAIVEARVPEVIGFTWPVIDSEAKRLAWCFYEELLKDFDTTMALYRARNLFRPDERIWAAPILIQQSDTRTTVDY